MKVLVLAYIGLASNDVGLRTARALERLGHAVEVLPFDEDLPWIERGFYFFRHALVYRSFNRRLVARARSFGPDLVLIVGSNWGVLPETLDRLKKLGVRLVIWDYSLKLWKGFQVESLPLYDAYFVLDSYMVPVLKNLAGVKRVEWLPACADPDMGAIELSAEDRARFGADAAFIGTAYPNRVELFRTIAPQSIRIWGKGWPDMGPHARIEVEPVWGLKKSKIYKATAVNLNIQGTALQISGVSERVFEIMACGGFVLSKSYPDLLTLFARSGVIEVFSDADDLRKKIGYYLTHDNERREMAARARVLVSAEHTYRHRVTRLLDAISG